MGCPGLRITVSSGRGFLRGAWRPCSLINCNDKAGARCVGEGVDATTQGLGGRRSSARAIWAAPRHIPAHRASHQDQPASPLRQGMGGALRLAWDLLGVRAGAVERLDARLSARPGRCGSLRRGQTGERVPHERGPTDPECRQRRRRTHLGKRPTPRLALRWRRLERGESDDLRRVPGRRSRDNWRTQRSAPHRRSVNSTRWPCPWKSPA